MEKKAYVGLYQDKRKEWRWRMKTANGEIVGASTEGYKNKTDMIKNLELVVLKNWSVSDAESE